MIQILCHEILLPVGILYDRQHVRRRAEGWYWQPTEENCQSKRGLPLTSAHGTAKLLYSESSLVNTCWGLAFGHPDIRTSYNTIFFWGYFPKERVYSYDPRSLNKLKHTTEETVANTDQQTTSQIHTKHTKLLDTSLWECEFAERCFVTSRRYKVTTNK